METIRIQLPDWVEAFLGVRRTPLTTDAERMRLVLDLTGTHIDAGTGGPFGAAVIAAASGEVVSVGLNRVVASHCSMAHAEMIAIASAQQRLSDYDLGRAVPGGCVIYSSAEPCAMCLGAIPWSGIGRLVYAARDADVRAIGFDEGHKPAHWIEGYTQRGIEVTPEVLREEAIELLQRYVAAGGEIYGAGT